MLASSDSMSLEHDRFVLELQSVARENVHERIVPVGAQTKAAMIPRARAQESPIRLLDMRAYQGIVSYDPSEFLITARAGTSIAEIQKTLTEQGQYLPFDPIFVGDFATLGGTIASGLSGPDRLLYGGIRDFIMEVAMIDGLGNLVRGGGKVVKNAAGFDTPKMMVGSYGRMGMIVEATLKVFPSPQAWATLLFENSSLDEATGLFQKVLSKPFPIAGVDLAPDCQLTIRMAAPASSLRSATDRIENLVARKPQRLMDQEHRDHRDRLRQWLELPVDEHSLLVKVAMSPREVAALHSLLQELKLQDWLVCSAGCAAWVRLPCTIAQQFSHKLCEISLSGIVVRGCVDDPIMGAQDWQQMAARIQRAIDPQRRFVAWNHPTVTASQIK